MNKPIEITQRLLIKSVVIVLLCLISSFQAAYSQTDRAAEALAFSLIYEGGSEKCSAMSLDMDPSNLAIDESDCMPGVVSGESDGSLVFTDLGKDAVTCSLVSLTIDKNDTIRVVTSGGCFDADLDDDGIPNRIDKDPQVDRNDCIGADVVLSEDPFSGVQIDEYGKYRYSCRANSSIDTDGNAIVIGIDKIVLFMAPSITMGGGFAVQVGGVFIAVGTSADKIPL